MAKLPPFPRPNFIGIGQNGQRIQMTQEFARWLDQLRFQTDINTAASGNGSTAPVGSYLGLEGSALPVTVAGYDAAFPVIAFASYGQPETALLLAEYESAETTVAPSIYASPDIDLTFAEYA